MTDFSAFQDIPGLLTPEMQTNTNRMALLGAAAGLLKGSGPSPYKNNFGPMLADGIQGLLTGYESGTNNALKQQLTRSQIGSAQIEMARKIAFMKMLGLDPSKVFGNNGSVLPDTSGGPAPAGATPAVPTPQAPPVPGLVSVGDNPAGPGSSGTPAAPGSMNLTDQPTTGYSVQDEDPATHQPIGPATGATINPPPADFGSRFGASFPVDKRSLALTYLAGGDKAAGEFAAKSLEPTNEMKNASASGKPSPLQYEVDLANSKLPEDVKAARTYGMTVPEYKGAVELSTKVAGAQGDRVAETIKEGGAQARTALAQLNLMEDAFNQAKGNYTSGPGADSMLKLKQLYSNLTGEKAEGLAPAEVISKLNRQLASNVLRTMTARGTQMEFKTFIENNPGLMTTEAGTRALINILRQDVSQRVELGRLAMKPGNAARWGDVEDKFYEEHPVISPWTGKPITKDGLASDTAASTAGRPAATPIAAPTLKGAEAIKALKVGDVIVQNGHKFAKQPDGSMKRVD